MSPGEVKLAEIVGRKTIGSFFAWFKRRKNGINEANDARTMKLVLAQAEREADEISSGEKSLSDFSARIEFKPEEISASPKSGPSLVAFAGADAIADQLRRGVNETKAILHAEQVLAGDHTIVSDDRVDDDWLYRWRRRAGEVSSEQLQEMFGRVLAGEIQEPGSYSLRLLDFVGALSKKEANLLEWMMQYVVHDSVAKDAVPKTDLTSWIELQGLGVISGVGGLGVTKTFSPNDRRKIRNTLISNGVAINMWSEKEWNQPHKIPAFILTNIGRQVTMLGEFEANDVYLKEVCSLIRSAGIRVNCSLTINGQALDW